MMIRSRRMTSSFNSRAALLLTLLMWLGACSPDPAPKAQAPDRSQWPLQPLIYTELPNLTEQAAAVRERRLTRELVEGQQTRSQNPEREQRLMPVTSSDQALGEALYQALITRDEALWEHAFVSHASYAHMVHIRLPEASKFVDEQLGASVKTWQLFYVEHTSEAPEGGLGQVFEFAGLELGQGRLASGRPAKDEPPDQHWGNILKLKLRGSEIVFDLHISKILRVVDRRKSPTGVPILSVASAVKASKELETFVDAGLHLKPELLRSQEYPYPLAIGNFWRYHRAPDDPALNEAKKRDPLEAIEDGLNDQPQNFEVSEVLLEVLNLELYHSARLVKLRRSFNDPLLTKQDFHWLMTPRRIYACSSSCARNVENMSWLLSYLQREDPLFEFPLRPGMAWGSQGKTARFEVSRELEDIEVPAGTFAGTLKLSGQLQDKALNDPFLTVTKQTRAFAPGKGVVRRTLEGVSREGIKRKLREELVESRIMP